MFAEALREGLPAPQAAGALLRRRLLRGSPSVESVEGATTLPQLSQRQAEATGAMPPQPGEAEGSRTRTKNCLLGPREGHPRRFFFLRPPGLL